MNNNAKPQHSTYALFVPLVIVSMMFMICRLPEAVVPFRPDLLTLVLIFFAVFDQRRISIEIAWLCGLILDLLNGSPLGFNALGCALQVYLIISQFKKFALFARWQQVIVIALINFIARVLGYWIGHIIGQPDYSVTFVTHTVVTALLWPLVALGCAFLCAVFSVSAVKEKEH